MDKTYTIITGATSGIGEATAKRLHLEGQHLILGNRNPEKSKALKKELLSLSKEGEIDIIQLDLASFESIRNFAEEVEKRYERIDVLINNAGVLMKKNQKTKEGFEMTLGVNYLGTFLLTELLLDKLTANGKSKLIFVSSVAAKLGKCRMSEDFFKNKKKGFWAYCNSKLALMMYIREIQKKNHSKLIIKAVHPGIVYSHIWKWRTKIGQSFDGIQRKIMKDPAKGAVMSVKIATTSEFDNDGILYYNQKKPMKLPKKIEDDEFRKKFVEFTKTVISNNKA